MGSLLLWQQSLHILKNIYLFIWLCQALVAACKVFIEFGVGSADLAHRLSCSIACGILIPRPGVEPVSPALAGGFLSTGPPRKSLETVLSLVCEQVLPYTDLNSPGDLSIHGQVRKSAGTGS